MIGVVPQTERKWWWDGLVVGKKVSREISSFEVYIMAEPSGNARQSEIMGLDWATL